MERLNEIAGQRLPSETVWLDRVYGPDIRLVGYQMDPAQPVPGDDVELTLYWQAIKTPAAPHHLIVQLADTRNIALGRFDSTLPGPDNKQWLPGEIDVTGHQFGLPSELDVPLAGRIEVSLVDEAQVPLQPASLAAEPLDPVVAQFTVAPHTWPALNGASGTEATWPAGPPETEIALHRHLVAPSQPQPGESISVTLFWETSRPVEQDYMIFVHLLDESGQIVAQNDSLPRAGAYPTPWWKPEQLVEDTHSVVLPDSLPDGAYRLVVGLYETANGERLRLADGSDKLDIAEIEIR